ncbi:TonB-dependent receptor [Mucilaginibacter sp. SP1R1]|uniref:TonB-dependent receptor n=1 Tax=Mucilaginibacter sp. SP1R1 TaxID=2723091 RepID=UPI00161F218F|nr:TonB-dependent receptor [Mucilaginibacter sp. SP1R1]MBB6148376.1 TonB-linked SusC/RagA family outer membrane protein [Mucilaginibacter sp. SP1R1]
MKLATLMIFLAILQCSATVLGQKINLNETNTPLKKVLKVINDETGYVFFYESKAIRNKNITIQVKDATLDAVLTACLKNQQLSYEIVNNTVFIKEQQVADQIPSVANLQPVSIKVTGQVVDEKNNALPGVTVRLKGGKTVVITDKDGKFSIDVPNSDAVLIFSFVGYAARELSAKQNLNAIQLTPTSSDLSQVVVIGYGTQDRHKVTSALVTVSGTELTKRTATDPTSLLQGQLPGLNVTQNSAEPGNESINLQVRGPGTFSNAGTSPLVIIDGLPGSISILNPGDIESVTLLKDASSEAIYGSRGANGVLVIKTKKGKNIGGYSLNYTYSLGVSNATRLPDLITNSATYMTLANQAQVNSGLQPIYTPAQIALYQNATDHVKYPNHNPLDDIFKTAYVQNHYINLTGGANSTTYNLGLGITNQPGIIKGFKYNKYTLALGLTSRVNKRVTFGVDLQARYSDRLYPENGGTDMFLSALAQAPTYPLKYNGLYIQSAFSNENHNKNVLAIAENSIAEEKNYYAQGNISLNVDIVDGLKWENRAGFNYNTDKVNDFRPKIQQYYFSDLSPAGFLDDGTPSTLYVNRNDNSFGIFYSQFNYSKQFGKHNLSAIAGYEQQYNQASNLDASRLNYPTNTLTDLNGGPASGSTNDGYTTSWAIKSFYSRLNYDYNDKYLFSATFRRDGTSRFLPGHQWGSFYSFSGGWRISQENFIKDVTWISDLKLRGSWGVVGNQNIGTSGNANYPYPSQALLSQSSYPFGGTPSTGFALTQLVDPSLTWESTRTTDIGIDLAIFNNKLTFTGDYFNKYTYNILRSSQVPYWLGLSAPTVNNGAVDNKGVEFALKYQDKIGKDFGFYISPNIQIYRNKLASFGAQEIGGNTIRRQGLPIDSYYMYVWQGIFQSQAEINNSPTQPITPTPGDLKIKDVNGDGKINDQDRTVIPGAYPNYTFGVNLGATWKHFDLNIQLYGVEGLKSYVTGWGIEPFRQGSIPTTDWLNAWTPSNPTNTLPKIYVPSYAGVDGYQSTYFLKDASFIRLKNVQLGYTLPPLLLSKIGLKSFRVYAAGDNLLLITKFPGLDPERTSLNGNYLNYPQARTFTFGVNASF